ncbi:MAG: hypothetical protein M3490_11360, partial [Chloroflexota bacterium]|nr:hypothetical protein [Chloroflexota bacterium]
MNMAGLPDLAFARPWAWWLLFLVPVVVAGGALLGRGRRTMRWSSLLRTVTLAFLVISLTGPLMVQGSRQTTTVFVVDRSESIPQASADAANQ